MSLRVAANALFDTEPAGRHLALAPGPYFGRFRLQLPILTRRLAIALGVCAFVAFWLAATAYLFVWPNDDPVRRADAIVVLGPGPNGERLRKAAQLLEHHVAPYLVVSEPKRLGEWGQLRVWCSDGRATCFRARPFTTRGEARHVARLAKDRNWKSIIVVTSRYHVVRARLLFGRCFRGTTMVVGAPPDNGPIELLRRATHEWGGLIYGLTVGRGC